MSTAPAISALDASKSIQSNGPVASLDFICKSSISFQQSAAPNDVKQLSNFQILQTRKYDALARLSLEMDFHLIILFASLLGHRLCFRAYPNDANRRSSGEPPTIAHRTLRAMRTLHHKLCAVCTALEYAATLVANMPLCASEY